MSQSTAKDKDFITTRKRRATATSGRGSEEARGILFIFTDLIGRHSVPGMRDSAATALVSDMSGMVNAVETIQGLATAVICRQ